MYKARQFVMFVNRHGPAKNKKKKEGKNERLYR